MRVIAIGGSNTLLDGGYVSQISTFLPQADILNRAIGDTNSTMGLYRLMTFDDLRPGDIIVWEYALNDGFGVKARGDEWHLRNLEYTIRFCAEKGCHILPVILATQVSNEARIPTPYVAKIHFLCAAYGIDVIDILPEVRYHLNLPKIPASDYRDESHYRPNGQMVKFVGARIADAIYRGLRRPRLVPPIYVRQGCGIFIRTDFDGPPKRRFHNSILDFEYQDLRDGGFVFAPQIVGGIILSCINMSSPNAGTCHIDINGKAFPLGMGNRFSFDKKPLLRAHFGWGPAKDISAEKGSVVRFSPADLVENDGGQARGIVAMVVEAPDNLNA
ncbi:MAG TPA: hypothetical protein VGC31_01570 [Paenirhodobacter sp.]